jgi:hypothetical protein
VNMSSATRDGSELVPYVVGRLSIKGRKYELITWKYYVGGAIPEYCRPISEDRSPVRNLTSLMSVVTTQDSIVLLAIRLRKVSSI